MHRRPDGTSRDNGRVARPRSLALNEFASNGGSYFKSGNAAIIHFFFSSLFVPRVLLTAVHHDAALGGTCFWLTRTIADDVRSHKVDGTELNQTFRALIDVRGRINFD